VVVLPAAAGEEQVGHAVPPEDPVVAQVADVFIEDGDNQVPLESPSLFGQPRGPGR
jgi:hypothetical protein